MREFEQYCVAGLSSAALYSMLAACWSLAWSVSRSLNLMLGSYTMVAGVCFGLLYGNHGWSIVPAIAVAVALAAVLGAATEALMRICRIGTAQDGSTAAVDTDAGGQLIVSLAGVLAVQEAVAELWGRGSFVVGNFVGGPPLRIGSADVNRQVVVIVAAAVVTLGGLELVLRLTRLGRGMRACAESMAGALCCGVNPRTMRLGVTMAAAVLAGFAGCVALPINSIDYQSSITFALFGLVAAIVGGLGSVPGAAMGGLLVGMAQAMISGYISSARSSAIVYALLVVILLVAPKGLAGLVPRASRRSRRRRIDEPLASPVD